MQAVRYRSGISATTGQVITGQAHLAQSIAIIWRTRVGERFMRLPFGSDLRSHLAEDVTTATALLIFNDLRSAIDAWEPEYAMTDFQLVSLTRKGGLGLKHGGLYFPEGRFGNTSISEPFGTVTDLATYEGLARRTAARIAA